MSACGGGSNSGGTPPPPTPVSFSPINGGNFVDIATHAVSTGDKFLYFSVNTNRPDNIMAWTGAAVIQFTDFSASEGNSNITVNGDAVLDFSLRNMLTRGGSMRITETIAGKLFFDRTVGDYNLLANSNLFTRSSTIFP